MEIGIAAGQFLRLIPQQRGFTGHRLPVETDKGRFAFGVNKAEGVDTKAFHGAIAARNAAVRHRPDDVMHGFRLQRDVIPEGVMGALTLRDFVVRFRLHGVHKVREFVRILNKEHGRVVADQVKHTLFGVELGGETADITHGIGRTCAALNRGETHKDRGGLLGIAEELRFGQIFQGTIRLEIAVCGRASGVHDTLRDTLMVKVRDLLTHNKVFQQRRTTRTGTQ